MSNNTSPVQKSGITSQSEEHTTSITQIITISFEDEKQKTTTTESFIMTEKKCYQLYVNEKYLGVEEPNDPNSNLKLILTKILNYSTSNWCILQSLSSNKVILYNYYYGRFVTFSDNNIILSNQKINENIFHPNIKQEPDLHISTTDLWLPVLYDESKISFKNAQNEDVILSFDNDYVLTNGKIKLGFDFLLDSNVVDFPGNCNISGIKLKNTGCKYLRMENGGIFCFKRSVSYVFLRSFESGYYFDLKDNSVKSTFKGNTENNNHYKWYIWIDNFNRLLIQPFSGEVLIGVSKPVLSEEVIVNASLTDPLKNNNIFGVELTTKKAYFNLIDGNEIIYLQALSNEDNSTVLLGTKKPIYIDTESMKNSGLQNSEIQELSRNLAKRRIARFDIGSSPLKINLSNLKMINDKIDLIKANVYSPKNKVNLQTCKSSLTEKYFDNCSSYKGCEFKYTDQDILDVVDLILKNTNINNGDYYILDLIFELYRKILGNKNNMSSNSDNNKKNGK